jgi:predicted nucleotidyltransferase component of viral defense system
MGTRVIDKREIIDAASALGLRPQVVEKDYALGWLLWGIYGHSALSEGWIFKGGTCLKKCFFETYRFSEDLDFTLTDPSHLDEAFLKPVFAEIGERIYEETGVEFPSGFQQFEIYANPRGENSCLGRIGYQGPVSPRGKNMPRIKLDLTADERLVLPPIQTPVFHPYSDAPDGGIVVRSYAYEEAFAEKIRALAERARPRDLYDVVSLYRNGDARPEASVVLNVLRQKCEFNGIGIPTLADIEQRRPDLDGGWSAMLAHQLPALPPIGAFWNELPGFFAWLEEGVVPVAPAAYQMAAGEETIRERILRFPVAAVRQSDIETIRFAASNRLCVDLDYQGSTRRIEPYSLRRTRDGNVILHAFNVDRGEHRSYRVDRIEGARATDQSFVPRYAIELTPSGPLTIPPTTTGEPSRSGFGPRPLQSPRSRNPALRSPAGPTYVYECMYCRKRFNRKKQTTTLRPHKDKSGFPCPGRTAYFIETRY